MIKQKITNQILHIPFQKEKFFIYIVFSLALFFASLYLTAKFPQIGNFPILIIIAYFFPSLIAFDITNEYKDSLNIPKINHPKKFHVLVLNVLIGWTIVGWLIALYLALTPGILEVIHIEYVDK